MKRQTDPYGVPTQTDYVANKLRTNGRKDWAKLDMVQKTFPHTLCVVSTQYETTDAVFTLKRLPR